MRMNKAERTALRRIHDLVARGRIAFTGHFSEEADDERTSEAEVVDALLSADECRWAQAHESWNVQTHVGLTIACVFGTNEAGEVVVVVTVFGRSDDPRSP